MNTQLPIYATMVLLVDDQPLVAEALRRLLANEPNMQLHYCSSVREAIEQANEIKPTVILQDLVMPEIDGLTAVGIFRGNPPTSEIPIIVLSSREDPAVKSQAFSAGANDYLVKIPDKIELIARIKYHSKSYLNQLQRDEAYRALRESQQQLLEKNTALVRLNQNLHEASKALMEAKFEAERANNAKSEFLSRMSHELRTPLHAILGFGELLEGEDLLPEHHDNVVQIMHGGRHLLQLINEVLDITRIEAGRTYVHLEDIELQLLMTECLSFLRPLAQARSIRVDFNPQTASDVYVRADRQKLRQVFLNILSNAVKYNRDGGTISVSWDQLPTGRVALKIADTGNGIAQEDLSRLFEAFDRLGAERSGVEGTGLGLAVSKRLIELMDGRIGVTSTVGAGTSFIITLPTVNPRLEREEPSTQTGSVQDPIRNGRP